MPFESSHGTTQEGAGPSGPRALRRVLQISELLAREPRGLSLAEIAAMISAPKSSVLSIMRALVEMRFAVRDHERYSIGPAMFNLAGIITAQWRIAPLARPIMQALHERTGETIILAELDREAMDVHYIDQIESTSPVRFTAKIGDRRPLYCSGAGRIFLAYQDPAWVDHYLNVTPLIRLTEETVTDRAEIERRVRRARKDGVGTSSGEVTDAGASYAAPIFQRDGSVHYALMVATVAIRLRQKAEIYRSAAIEAAAEISSLLGYDEKREGEKKD